jgi:putative ABC transport system permease protein
MNTITNISIWDLVFGFTILIIPFIFFLSYRIKIAKDVIISIVRMVLQLALVAFYLEWIFAINNAWINTLWVILMISVGVYTSISRVGLNWKYFLLPLFIAGLTSVVIIDIFFLGFILKLDYFFDARYFIPITGMVLGNSLNHNIVGLSTYFKGLSEKSDLYYFLLTNTGNSKLALNSFVREAIKQGLNPLIATMSVIGLISLPGMMTGQILGGSSPVIAIKYQIMIMLAIFVGCTTNLFLSIILSNRFVFDGYGKLKMNMLKSSK